MADTLQIEHCLHQLSFSKLGKMFPDAIYDPLEYSKSQRKVFQWTLQLLN